MRRAPTSRRLKAPVQQEPYGGSPPKLRNQCTSPVKWGVTSSRWLAVLLILVPTLPPFCYGVYLMATRRFEMRRELPVYEQLATAYVSFVVMLAVTLGAVGLVWWWLSWVVALWVE
jgi:hypothetical protein